MYLLGIIRSERFGTLGDHALFLLTTGRKSWLVTNNRVIDERKPFSYLEKDTSFRYLGAWLSVLTISSKKDNLRSSLEHPYWNVFCYVGWNEIIIAIILVNEGSISLVSMKLFMIRHCYRKYWFDLNIFHLNFYLNN